MSRGLSAHLLDYLLRYLFFFLVEGPQKPECKFTDEGLDYVGNLRVAKNGRPCTNWTAYTEAYKSIGPGFTNPIQNRFFPDGSVSRAHNYCRNPDRDKRGPWCFTGNSGNIDEYDFCDVPQCSLGKLLIINSYLTSSFK